MTDTWHKLFALGREYAQLELHDKPTARPFDAAKLLANGHSPFTTVAFNTGRQVIWEIYWAA